MLHYNQLKELPESIGNLINLTELTLNNNRLNELPESIGSLTNLTELALFQSHPR
jgi:internalin A